MEISSLYPACEKDLTDGHAHSNSHFSYYSPYIKIIFLLSFEKRAFFEDIAVRLYIISITKTHEA